MSEYNSLDRLCFPVIFAKGGEIDFLAYLDAVNRAQRTMYESSEQGMAAAAKTGKVVGGK